MRSGRLRSRGPKSTGSSNPSRAQKGDLSDDNHTTYLAPRGILRSSRSASIEGLDLIAIKWLIFIERRSRSDGWRRTRIVIAAQGSVNPDRSSNWSPSDGLEASWKNSTIAVRSNCDRGAIEPRSGSLRDAIASSRSENDQRLTRTSIVARSWVFLRRKSWPFRSKIEAKLWLIPSQSGSYVLAK